MAVYPGLLPRSRRDSAFTLSTALAGGGGTVKSQEEADALKAQFEKEHPFAPSGSFTAPTVAPAPDSGAAAALASPEIQAMASRDYRDQGSAAALATVLAGGGATRRGRGTAGGGETALDSEADPMVSPLLQAAQGLADMKRASSTRDILRQLTMSGMMPNESDAPEVRANKEAYYTKRLNETIAHATGFADEGPRAPGSPVYTGSRPVFDKGVAKRSDGKVPSTLEATLNSMNMRRLPGDRYAGLADATAALAAQMRAEAGRPGLRKFGTDSYGRPVEGLMDRQGNVSRIAPPDKPKGTQLAQLIDERDAYKAAGREDVVKQYDQVINTYGQKYDAFGNPIQAKVDAAEPELPPAVPAAGPASPAAPNAVQPKTKEEWAALPVGTRYLGLDGKTYIKK